MSRFKNGKSRFVLKEGMKQVGSLAFENGVTLSVSWSNQGVQLRIMRLMIW
jgi:hypothetical protein